MELAVCTARLLMLRLLLGEKQIYAIVYLVHSTFSTILYAYGVLVGSKGKKIADVVIQIFYFIILVL